MSCCRYKCRGCQCQCVVVFFVSVNKNRRRNKLSCCSSFCNLGKFNKCIFQFGQIYYHFYHICQCETTKIVSINMLLHAISSCKQNILQFGQINLAIYTNTLELLSVLVLSNPWLLLVDQIFCLVPLPYLFNKQSFM